MTLTYSVKFTVEWYARQRNIKLYKLLNAINGVTNSGWYKGPRAPYAADTELTLDEVKRFHSFRKWK